MKKISTTKSLRRASPTALAGLTTLAMAAGAPSDSLAQDNRLYPIDPSAESSSLTLPTITVTGNAPNTLKKGTNIGRLPATVQDTPQVINVVPQEVLQQQQVTTLEQALRNSPGITTAIGEGGGGMNGDQFRIRGFEAKGDIYTDGLRDFGVYVRDSFNYEDVQVLKGPSSGSFGVGTTGGAINTNSKVPHLEDFYRATIAGGEGPLLRGTFDVNKQVNETTAVRLNGLAHKQDVLDRDHVESDRYGVAASVGFGLGTAAEWVLSYFFQHYERTPDYGVPVLTPGFEDIATRGALGQPITEFGVRRDIFYGKETDKDIGNVHAVTSRFAADLTDWLVFNNDTRLAIYDRDFATSVPTCATSTVSAAAYNASCTGRFFNGLDGPVTFGGGNPGYFQESWGIQNISTAIAEFQTGWFRHELVAGVDLLYQDDERVQNAVVGSKGAQSLRNPVFENTTGYRIQRNPDNRKFSDSFNVGLFASDRIWLTDELSVLGGVRWDYFDVSYDATTDGTAWTRFDQETDFFSPKASVIWEPTEDQTYYFSWATSASIAGQFPTNANATLTDPSTAVPGVQEVQPEENESFELGGKVAILDGRLGLSGALFRVDKDNAFFTDPTTGDPVATNESQRVQGVELGASGELTEHWTLLAAYTYLDSEILDNGTSAQNANVGNEVAFVPEHAASFWTTYDIMHLIAPDHAGELLVGGGITWRDDVFLNSANNAFAPENFSLDALVSYEQEHWKVALNGYNLTDELNYDGLWSSRVIPSSGRAFTLTGGVKF